jgi:hypothetical protein
VHRLPEGHIEFKGTTFDGMRLVRLLLVGALGATLFGVAPAVPVSAAPAGCRSNSSGIVEFCDQYRGTPGALGSIGLLGDSVLLGSLDGMSAPSLPDMLSASGFGPIRSTTSLGMTTFKSASSQLDASAFHWLSRWQAAGFTPKVLVVNLGANHLGECTSPAPCKLRIDQFLNEVQARYPTTPVWWAKIVHYSYVNGVAQYSSSMRNWNAALDQAAAERPRLTLWDWPAALASANPPIQTDLAGVHPSSGAQYVRRNTAMNSNITLSMGAAQFTGGRVALPAGAAAGLEYAPVPGFVALNDGAPTGPGQVRTVDLSGTAPANARGALVTLRVSGPAANGYATAYACDAPTPVVSNLNYAAGRQRSAQAVAGLSASRSLCVLTSAATGLTVIVHGYFVAGQANRLTPVTPARLLDTRNTGRAGSFRLAAPSGASVVALNVTSAGPSTGGQILVSPCDSPAETPAEVSFGPNEVIGSSVFVRPSAAGEVCVEARTAGGNGQVDVVVDLTATMAPAGALRLTLATPTRLLDTRSVIGGWLGRHGADQTIDVLAAPPGAQAVTGSVTIVRPTLNSHLRATACGNATPPTAAVNSPAGQVIVNSTTMGLSSNQLLCLYASATTHSIFDVTGWWTA